MAELTGAASVSAPPPLFVAEFDYVFEDYRQAFAAQQRSLLPPGTFLMTLGGWMSFMVMGAFLYMLLQWSAARRGMGGMPVPRPSASVVVVRLLVGLTLPLLGLLGFGLYIRDMIKNASKGAGPTGQAYRPPVEQFIAARRPVATAAVGIAMAQAVLLFAATIMAQPAAGGASLADELAAAWPYALGAGAVVGLLVFRAQVQAVRKMWNGQPALHLRKTLVVHDDGFSIGDSSSVTQTQWVAVKRFIETPALFMLMLGDYTFHMVPKRAFAGNGAVEEFRALLRLKVQSPTGAFPVMPAPAAAPPPLPIPPLRSK